MACPWTGWLAWQQEQRIAMKPEIPDTTDPRQLSKLIEVEAEAENAWAPEEWTDVFLHQLQAPLATDLIGEDPDIVQHLAASCKQHKQPLVTFGDLIRGDKPPLDLLFTLKGFAKKLIGGSETGIPREIATVLYYVSIVLAFRIHKKRISDLDSKSLREGLEWSLCQPWISSDIRRILEDGLASL